MKITTALLIGLGILISCQSCISYQLPSNCKIKLIDEIVIPEEYYLTGEVYYDSIESQNRAVGVGITIVVNEEAYHTNTDLNGSFIISIPKTIGYDTPTLIVSSGGGYLKKIVNPLNIAPHRRNKVIIILLLDPAAPSL